MVEGETRLKLSSDLHTCAVWHIYIPIHKQISLNSFFKWMYYLNGQGSIN